MIIITGIPGSGKSTLVRKRYPNFKRINLDTLKSRSREEKEILAALERGENLVVDNTNTTARSRKRYIDFAKAFGAQISSIYIDCPLELAMERNRKRKAKEQVPAFVLRFYFRKLQQPKLEEGFDSCEVIKVNESQQVIS